MISNVVAESDYPQVVGKSFRSINIVAGSIQVKMIALYTPRLTKKVNSATSLLNNALEIKR